MAKKKQSKKRRSDPTAAPTLIGAMTIERVPVSKINPAPYNPRKDLRPGDPDYQKLKRSIEDFGYVDPLIWNKRTGTLVGGHQRLKILVNEHAATEVDVSVVDLDEAAEKALNVALNKIAGACDDPALAKLLLELKSDTEGNVTSTGFDDDEVDRILKQYELPEPGDATEDSVFTEQVWGAVVEVDSEPAQVALIERLTKEGYKCRAIL